MKLTKFMILMCYLDVSELVRDDKLKVKSEETRRSEKMLSSFRAQISRLEREISITENEISSYSSLNTDVHAIVSGSMDVDLKNPDHTRAVAYLKKHVSG